MVRQYYEGFRNTIPISVMMKIDSKCFILAWKYIEIKRDISHYLIYRQYFFDVQTVNRYCAREVSIACLVTNYWCMWQCGSWPGLPGWSCGCYGCDSVAADLDYLGGRVDALGVTVWQLTWTTWVVVWMLWVYVMVGAWPTTWCVIFTWRRPSSVKISRNWLMYLATSQASSKTFSGRFW